MYVRPPWRSCCVMNGQGVCVQDPCSLVACEPGFKCSVNVLSCTVYLADMARFAEMNEVWLAFFGDRVPARATIGVQALAIGAAVEIECVAQRTITTAG